MSLPDIAIINFSSESDAAVQEAIRSVNRQVMEDFMPLWGSGYVSKLHASWFDPAAPQILQEDPVPAEAVIYIVDQPHLPGALGYHSINNSEVPVGFVFTDLGQWTVTLSHEVLELIVDPTVNIFVPGPDPRDPANPNAWVLHAYEVCDAVERTTYLIDGVRVSNFVTPQYFQEGDAPGTRNDFLGVGVPSFGVTPGSHLGFIDPGTGHFDIIVGSASIASCGCHKHRFAEFETKEPRHPREATFAELEQTLAAFNKKPPKGCSEMRRLGGIRRRERYAYTGRRYREMFNRRS